MAPGYTKKPLIVRVGRQGDFAEYAKKLEHSIDLQSLLVSQFYNADMLEKFHLVFIRFDVPSIKFISRPMTLVDIRFHL